MNTTLDPQELVVELLKRSTCSVQVAAVLADRHGVFSWGWNSSGSTGFGEHAEAMCIRRANPSRVPLATLYVAARRKKSRSPVLAMPCRQCWPRASKCLRWWWRKADRTWATKDGAHFG